MWWPAVEKGRTLSKKTQRRVAVAGLSFVLGAAGAIPALAASEGGTADAPAAPNYLSSMGDTLYNLPFVSYLPGQDIVDDTSNVVDDTSNFVDDTGGGGIVGGGGGIVGGLGGIVHGLPLLGGLMGGGASAGGPVAGLAGTVGGLPLVGPVVGGVLGAGGSASVGSPVAGLAGTVGGLPVVGPVVGGLLGSLMGSAGGLLSGGFL